MAIRVMSLVWDAPIPGPEKFTLIALADRADEDGQCWTSTPALARMCSQGTSTVRRHLSILRSQGLIHAVHCGRSGVLYALNLNRLRELWDPMEGMEQLSPLAPRSPSRTTELGRQRRRFHRSSVRRQLRLEITAGLHHCEPCGATEDLVVDHIYPLSRGGTNDLSNLQVLCSLCNCVKGARV